MSKRTQKYTKGKTMSKLFVLLALVGIGVLASQAKADTHCRTVCEIDGWGDRVCTTICQEY